MYKTFLVIQHYVKAFKNDSGISKCALHLVVRLNHVSVIIGWILQITAELYVITSIKEPNLSPTTSPRCWYDIFIWFLSYLPPIHVPFGSN